MHPVAFRVTQCVSNGAFAARGAIVHVHLHTRLKLSAPLSHQHSWPLAKTNIFAAIGQNDYCAMMG